MGRPLKNKNEHRVKFGISIDPKLFYMLSNEILSKSKFIEKLIKEYYEKKNI